VVRLVANQSVHPRPWCELWISNCFWTSSSGSKARSTGAVRPFEGGWLGAAHGLVLVRERERERERARARERECVGERERERVCVCERECVRKSECVMNCR
jgi:hypothetical protein